MTMDPTQPVAPVSRPAPVPGPSPVVAVRPRAKSVGVINIMLLVAAVLAVGGVAFAIGRSTAPASVIPGGGGPGSGNVIRPGGSFDPANGGPRGFAIGGGLSIAGTVTAIDGDSLTLRLENGDETTFTIDAATTYSEATDVSSADVAVGDDVSVQVDGGGRVPGGGGTTPELTANGVTVSR